MAENTSSDITALTVQLLSAFVSKNEVSSEGLGELIKTTRAALTEDLAAPASPPEPEYVPAVTVRKSLSSPDHILSLIDGQPYKTLKRHLAANGLTEKEYRERYSLSATYPMVAPNYSQMRRAVAEASGLGKKSAAPDAASAAAIETVTADAPPATARKAPAKAPSKKTSGKGAAVKTDPSSAVIVGATTSPAANAPAPRKKLSMFGDKSKDTPSSSTPKDEKAAAAKGAAPAEKPKAAKKAPAKAKGAAKSNSLKSALKAAGAHLGNSADKQSDEPAA